MCVYENLGSALGTNCQVDDEVSVVDKPSPSNHLFGMMSNSELNAFYLMCHEVDDYVYV